MLVTLVGAIFMVLGKTMDSWVDQLVLLNQAMCTQAYMPVVMALMVGIVLYVTSIVIFYPLSYLTFWAMWRCGECRKSLHRHFKVSYCHHCGHNVKRDVA